MLWEKFGGARSNPNQGDVYKTWLGCLLLQLAPDGSYGDTARQWSISCSHDGALWPTLSIAAKRLHGNSRTIGLESALSHNKGTRRIAAAGRPFVADH